jgi:chromosome segregation ATPase
MTDGGNAFQRAAETLAQVRELVLSGDQLRDELRRIASDSAESARQVEHALKGEIAAISRLAEDVLAQYRSAAKELSAGVRTSNDQLEATTAQIRAEAVKTITDLNDRSDSALKRVSAEMTIAQDRYAKSAASLQSVASESAERISGQAQELEKVTTALGGKIEKLTAQLHQLVAQTNERTKSIRAAETAISASQSEMVRAREDVASMKQALAKQGKWLIAAVFALPLSTVAVGAWLYFGLRHG